MNIRRSAEAEGTSVAQGRPSTYTEKEKDAIFAVVTKARAGGANWEGVFKLAKEAGWRSNSLGSLKQSYRKAGGFVKAKSKSFKGKKSAPAPESNGAAVAALAPAAPVKSKAPSAPALSAAMLTRWPELDSVISQIVEKQVAARMSAIVACLEQALVEANRSSIVK